MRLIDADALIEKAYHEAQGMAEPFKGQFGVLVEWLVEKTPTIEPERKKGKWVYHESQNDRYDDMVCPFCKKSYTVDAYRIDDIGFTAEDFNFCPNCGADMRGE